MSVNSYVLDGTGSGTLARVTSIGQLVTVPYAYDEVSSQTMGTDNTAVNFYTPKAGKQFVITGIYLFANRNVGVNDATVVIYEATSASTATVSTTLFTTEMVKQTRADLLGLNILVSEGVWINGKTDDDDVFGTITGYYIPTLS